MTIKGSCTSPQSIWFNYNSQSYNSTNYRWSQLSHLWMYLSNYVCCWSNTKENSEFQAHKMKQPRTRTYRQLTSREWYPPIHQNSSTTLQRGLNLRASILSIYKSSLYCRALHHQDASVVLLAHPQVTSWAWKCQRSHLCRLWTSSQGSNGGGPCVAFCCSIEAS